MSVSWVLPAAKELYAHRAEVQSVWTRIQKQWLGQKRELVVTGMAGAGKTVLFDHLSGVRLK